MAEELILVGETKAERYQGLLPQVYALWEVETDLIANLANTSAALHQAFGLLWVGFYLLKGDELVLGPFQGPIACTRIALGRGVCGKAAISKQTIIVPNVHQFEDHIACSSRSQSEIVLPILKDQHLLAVLDIDSEHLNHFDNTDKQNLEALCEFIAQKWK